MKLQRFVGDYTLVAGQDVTIAEAEMLNQLRNVFRLSVGDRLILCDNDFNDAVCEIVDLKRDMAKVKVIEIKHLEGQIGNKVYLYCAIIKNENFDLVVQKATEEGVAEIIPVITRRTVKTNLKYERLRKIIKEAVEQSGRGQLPGLREAVSFDQAIVSAVGTKIIFDVSGSDLGQMGLIAGDLSIFVGPEGGWEDSEIELAQENGARVAAMGGLTLRAETAAIIASYLAVNN